MLQVRNRLGPKLGFQGCLDPNSLLEIAKVHRTFRGGWISILDRSASVIGHRRPHGQQRTLVNAIKFQLMSSNL